MDVRNLLTGSVVGSSQVTAVVRRTRRGQSSSHVYRVAFQAVLVEPYFVELRCPVWIPESSRPGSGDGALSAHALLELRKKGFVKDRRSNPRRSVA